MSLYADYIFDGRKMHKEAALLFDSHGKIDDILENGMYDPSTLHYYPGLITPGFINTHCHLELSHLKNRFNTGTGLITFLNQVVSQRETEQEIINEAIQAADLEMHNGGIVAVGDISNKADTILTKRNSKIKYHSFIECFDFHQDEKANDFFQPYLDTYLNFADLPKSLTPHAPYSVSRKLFELINQNNLPESIISIHNQEVADEDQLFQNKTGGFEKFFGQFGFSLENFKPISKNSIYYSIENLSSQNNSLFVHNTLTQKNDIDACLEWNKNSYFVTCPNANLFIENKLPAYDLLQQYQDHICIGTDSYSSNWKLSILDEIFSILKYNSFLSLEQVFQWACINGARALKMDHDFGSFEKGKKPGINWIQDIAISDNQLKLKSSSLQKII